jgi:NAD(P) transhydrogenase subunit alpha
VFFLSVINFLVIGILKEAENENRVALTPQNAKKMATTTFLVEKDAGGRAGYCDLSYPTNVSFDSRKAVLERSKIILSIGCPDLEAIRAMRSGTVLIGQLSPYKNIDAMKQLARIGVLAFSIELLPRTTKAQFMDVLSSQSSLAGYQAVIHAAFMLGRTFPMMITAAGNIPAVRVLVIGAGVAGLQAIATAKRLGAVVSAFDVRSSSKTEVESLGASFIEVPFEESGDGTGGYAKEMSAEYKAAQAAQLLEVIAKQDVVITTAQIPHKPAPRIISKEMVEAMPENSLIIDLAGESGGNCELSQYGKEVALGSKRVYAPFRIVNSIANTASVMFSANLLAFVKNLLTIDGENVQFDIADVLVQNTLITNDGVIMHQAINHLSTNPQVNIQANNQINHQVLNQEEK